ncbi:MAG: MFS transporter [Clostridiaceae bacterium]|jgi:oligogalacturonide transporter|nr:MFS transporter [Clostridiaceae bacterium]
MEEIVTGAAGMPPDGKKEGKLAKIWHVGSYAFGDALGGGAGMVISTYYMVFLVFVMKMPPLLAGLIMGLGKIWDGFIDPAMGIMVDRTKSKLGACRPWLIASVVPILVAYFFLWYSFGIQGVAGKFFYFLFAYVFYSTAVSMATVPYEALLPRMVDGYHERTNYSSLRMIFSGLANVGTTYLYDAIIHVTADNPPSPVFAHDYMILGIVLGIIFAVPPLVTFLGSREKIRIVPDERLNVRRIFKNYAEVLKSKIYRKFFFISTLGAFASYAISSALVVFVLLVYGNLGFKLTLGTFVFPLTLSFLVINIKGALEIAFFVPNVVLMKKVNKHFPLLIDLPILALGCAIVLFVTPSTPLWVYLTGVGFIGAGSSCLAFVANTLMPDMSDVDELIYGKRREGITAGLYSLSRQVTNGLAMLVFGIVLTVFNLDTETASPELATNSTLAALKLMLCVIPMLCGIGMFLISRTYRLNAESHAVIKRRIAERRENGFVIPDAQEIRMFEKITGFAYSNMWISGAGSAENQALDEYFKESGLTSGEISDNAV